MSEPRPRSALREDQRFISGLMRREPHKLIVSRMGSGKTGATLDAVRFLLDSFTVLRVLIIAPKLVAQETWPAEIAAWEHTRILRFAVAVGTDRQRREAIDAGAEITVINRENLVWLWKRFGENADNWPYDCVIVDESSMFKAGRKRTARSKVKDAKGNTKIRRGGKMTRFGVLAAVRGKIDNIYLLTGTPGELLDLWGQIYLLDRGRRLGATQSAYHKTWFDKNPYSYEIKPRPEAEEQIMRRIADVMVSLPPLDLVPPPVFVPVKVKLSPKVMREYREFERTLVSETHDVEAVSKGVLTNKLLQFANGSMYREDRSIAAVHTAKLDALGELIERAAGDPMIVFYGFKFDLDAIRKRHPEAVVLNETPTAVKDWNAGKIRILLAHPASCAHGLNLQYGGHLACWYGLTWSLELYLQANARLPRPGQTDLVAIYQIIAEGTADENVLVALGHKGANQDRVTGAVIARLAA